MNRFLRHILTHPYTTVALVALTTMGIAAVGKHTSEWDETYVLAAKTLLQGGDMYKDFIGYVYPPFSAWLTIPFTVFPPRVARAIWYVICAVSLVYVVKSSWRVSGGKPLEPVEVSREFNDDRLGGTLASRDREGARESQTPESRIVLTPSLPYGRGSLPTFSDTGSRNDHVAFLIAQTCVLQLALNALTHLQPDLLIAALLMAGCVALTRGRCFVAATWIGLSSAFKVTPLLFVPYLMWRRRWAAAGWVVIVALAVNLLPDTVHSPRRGGTWVGEWSRLILAPMTRSDYVPGNWANKVNNNQALSGAIKRWMATTWSVGKDEILVGQRPGAASAGTMRVVFGVVGLAILLPVGIAMWRRRSDAIADPIPVSSMENQTPSTVAIECGIVLLLMLLFSPNSSRSHFCIMYLPAFCVSRLAVRPGASLLIRTLLVLAVISSTLSIHIRLPSTMLGEQVLLWLGVVMFCALFLLMACTVALMTPVAADRQLMRMESAGS